MARKKAVKESPKRKPGRPKKVKVEDNQKAEAKPTKKRGRKKERAEIAPPKDVAKEEVKLAEVPKKTETSEVEQLRNELMKLKGQMTANALNMGNYQRTAEATIKDLTGKLVEAENKVEELNAVVGIAKCRQLLWQALQFVANAQFDISVNNNVVRHKELAIQIETFLAGK